MQVMVGDRRTGRTTELAAWVKEKPQDRVLIVPTSQIRRFTMQEYNLTHDQVLTYTASMPALRGRRNVEVAIDNLEWLFHDLGIVQPVALVSIEGTYVRPPLISMERFTHLVRHTWLRLTGRRA